jgi:hypothetical protein
LLFQCSLLFNLLALPCRSAAADKPSWPMVLHNPDDIGRRVGSCHIYLKAFQETERLFCYFNVRYYLIYYPSHADPLRRISRHGQWYCTIPMLSGVFNLLPFPCRSAAADKPPWPIVLHNPDDIGRKVSSCHIYLNLPIYSQVFYAHIRSG